MLNETRVNLKHLLEDIRDSYTSPLEEIIITELIANALDSKASRIDFVVNSTNRFLLCLDNGQGMKRPQLKEYHNIAASTKQRGQGIGFAGVGGKLALLLADKVITESKGGYGSRAATEWRLTNPYRAPWKFIPAAGAVPTSRGTAVTIYFSDQQIHLLNQSFIQQTIFKHFYPLLHDALREEVLRFVYKKGMEFVINGQLLTLPEDAQRADSAFKIYLSGGRKPVGEGFLTKKVFEQNWFQKLTGREAITNPLLPGLSVSTYGKIIKSGWEWLGILPKNHLALCGIAEIPALSELLTTNKNDFLSDAASLKKYYKYRKAIQQAVLPALRQLGEYPESEKPPVEKNIKPLTRQIENALANLTNDFPELSSLLGRRRGAGPGKAAEAQTQKKINIADSEKINESLSGTDEEAKKSALKKDETDVAKSRMKKTGLQIILAELSDTPKSLGHMVEETITVNTLHPAWKKALQNNLEEYHILLTVGLVLSEFVDPEKHPQEFLQQFLASWGQLKSGAETLF